MYIPFSSPDACVQGLHSRQSVNLSPTLMLFRGGTAHLGSMTLLFGTLIVMACLLGFNQPALASDSLAPESDSVEILVGLRNPALAGDQLRAASLSVELTALSMGGEVTSVETHDTRGTAFISCDDLSVPGLRLTIDTDDPNAAAAILARHPDVLFAVPNAPVYAADRLFDQAELLQYQQNQQNEAKDALFQKQVAFEIEDPLYPEQQWYMEQIKAHSALEQVIAATEAGASATVESVVVAIIDSGIDAEHPEFTGRLQQGYNFLRPTELPADDYGHGTHVAGLIGAAVNNGVGIAGVAPNVTILAYKTLDQNGGGTIDNVVKAICRAVDDGADIINLSLTSPSQNTAQYTAAFDYARERGVMMIAAAGNSRQTRNMWPARLDDVMAIAATNQDGDLASYSSPGDSIDMAAPGGEFDVPLISTWPSSVNCNGVAPVVDSAGGAYCDSIGTSMSAALVSGIAAVLKGFHPDATAEDIRTMLKDTAYPLSLPQESVGAGLLDAERAVAGAMSSKLAVLPVFDSRSVPLASPPYDINVSIANPSFEILEWSIAEPSLSWLSLSANGGTTQFGSGAELAITVTPQDLAPGNYGTPLTVIGKRPDGTLLFQNIQLLLQVDNEYDEKGQFIVSKEPVFADWVSENSQSIITTTVEFTNVGKEELVWDVTLENEIVSSEPWVRLDAPITGTVGFTESVPIALEIVQTNAAVGENRATLTIRAKRNDDSFAAISTDIVIHVAPDTLLPLFISSSLGSEQ